MSLYDQVQQAGERILTRAPIRPRVGIVLGSGLGDFADAFDDKVIIPYHEVPGFPASSVVGHAGRLVIGVLGGAPIVAMQGRIHFYEGYSPSQVTFPVRVLCSLGIRSLVVTNAAGGIRQDLLPGDLMAISDHINLSGSNPLVGPNDDRLGPRFPDMSAAYDPKILAMLSAAAKEVNVSLKEGVYACLSGPSYETPAEIRMLRAIGADAVGMSTVPEVIVAAHMGVRVAGISCISNHAAGIGSKRLSHADVAVVAASTRDKFASLLSKFLPAIAQD